ncbi:DUF11 domain-containing protein [Thermomonospora umbrina]|uniref:Putative repeat protein (TIGR01451 family) n=1 Tax=Thermomonospora umbrina TaxID=111806 RepID=A0A3D9SHW2_9ACTN|nr:DUF11 domain-containing protein [Thermomonospora umbrina]REE95508.1 putative repeat protein (TIGR01451 family) [Thermomonospora umbrina]
MRRFIVPAVAAVAVFGAVTPSYAGTLPAQGEAGNDLVASSTGTKEVRPGGTLSFTGSIKNAGPGAQPNASASIFVSGVRNLQAPGCTVLPSKPGDQGLAATCALGTLAVGQSKTVRWTATVAPGTKDQALLSVLGAEPVEGDANPNNNGSVHTVKIVYGADLATALSGPKVVMPKRPVAYKATVRNGGPTAAKGVKVTFTVPKNLSRAWARGCVNTPGKAICTVGDLNVGASRTVSLTGIAAAPVGKQINVAATAAARSPYDPRTGNNTARTRTTVRKLNADVRVAGGAVGTFRAGGTGVYRLTVGNAGPFAARNVLVTGALPKGLTLAGVKGCAKAGNGIRCTLPNLAAGASKTIEVTVRIARNVRGPVVFKVSAKSATPDWVMGNNTRSVRKVVLAP